jgi:hypothetical protein
LTDETTAGRKKFSGSDNKKEERMSTLKNNYRPMTAGEIRMARALFQNAINYSAVKVYNGDYLPFGLQNSRVAMTPDGNMYYPEALFREDFPLVTSPIRRCLCMK